MSEPDKKRILESILNDFMDSEDTPNYASLEKWVRKYPEYKEELTEFVINWSLMEKLPPSDDFKEVDSDTLVLRAMSIVEDRIHAHALKKQSHKSEIQDLIVYINKKGLGLPVVAIQTDMGIPMITKILRRLIKFSSIPEVAFERISRSIEMSIEDLKKCLDQSIMAPGGFQFTSKNDPIIPKDQENFFDAVRADRTLDDSKRNFWLSFENKES